jgi:hypothetical protein
MYRIKYNKETQYYTVTKNYEHQISNKSYQRCVDFISQFDTITYKYQSFTV